MRDARIDRQRRRIHRESVVLAGDHHAPVLHVLHRMVCTAMAELHLHRLRAHRQPHQLVPEADAEQRHARIDELARRVDRVVARLGVAGAVGQQHAVRLQRQRLASRGLRRYYGDAAAALGQLAQDVILDAEIVGDHVEFAVRYLGIAHTQFPFALCPRVGFGAAYFPGQIHSGQSGETARRCERCRLVRAGGDATVLRALGAQDARQLACIDPGDRHHVVGFEIVRQRLRVAPVAHRQRQIADHQPAGEYPARLHIFGIHPDVADVRIGQCDDLLAVGRVGEDFLIAGHRGIEYHLADAAAGSTDGNAPEYRAIGKHKNGRVRLRHRNTPKAVYIKKRDEPCVHPALN
jgi:hypothetical protein